MCVNVIGQCCKLIAETKKAIVVVDNAARKAVIKSTILST
ncbi:hypothetical protein SRRS_11090 [Sporomusa rhizae]